MHPDERGMVSAILAAPGDDLPRLVYADGLDGRGRPERAELIRLQCRLAVQPVAATEPGDVNQLQQLRAAHGDGWVAELGLPPYRQTYFRFRRGMVGAVWCNARYFVSNAAAAMGATPVRAVTFGRLSDRNVGELAGHPLFARVGEVEFLMDETPVYLVRHFLRQVPLGAVHTLDLHTRTIASAIDPDWHERNVELAVAIASAPGLAGLRRLRLRRAGGRGRGGARSGRVAAPGRSTVPRSEQLRPERRGAGGPGGPVRRRLVRRPEGPPVHPRRPRLGGVTCIPTSGRC